MGSGLPYSGQKTHNVLYEALHEVFLLEIEKIV